MAKFSKEIVENIKIADSAVRVHNGVASWTNTTLDNLTPTGGMRPEEISMIADAFKSNSGAYSMLAKKSHIPVESDTAFFEYCKAAGIKGLPRSARDMETGKQISYFFSDYLIKALRNEKVEGDFNKVAIPILAAAEYHAQLMDRVGPHWERLEDYQQLVRSVEKLESRGKTSNLQRVLEGLNVNFEEFRNCASNVHVLTPENPEEARIGDDVRRIGIENTTNSGLRNAEMAARQADSALVSNAVLERILEPSSQWSFQKSVLTDTEALDLLCREGETKDQLFSRIGGYAAELRSILPRPSQNPSREEISAYREMTERIVSNCVKEGAFSFESAEERFTAIAKATADERVGQILFENRENWFSPEEIALNYPSRVNQEGQVEVGRLPNPFMFDHNGSVLPVNTVIVTYGDNPPQWYQEQNAEIGDPVTDVERAFNFMHEKGGKVPEDFVFTDLSSRDLRFGNILTQRAYLTHAHEKGQRIKSERAVQKNSLPNLAYDGSFYSDIPYYLECQQMAARNYAKYGIYFKTNSAPTADPNGGNGQPAPDPTQGDGNGQPDPTQGDGNGQPDPTQGDGNGQPAPGDGNGQPDPNGGNGQPRPEDGGSVPTGDSSEDPELDPAQ